MASLASDAAAAGDDDAAATTRRPSTFIPAPDAEIDAATASDWAAMAGRGPRAKFDDAPASDAERAQIADMRAQLGTLLTKPPLSLQPENVSDFKLLRFLRGFARVTDDAVQAFREMAEYRAAHGTNDLRDKLMRLGGDSGGPVSPHLVPEYKPIVDLIARGIRHEYGLDRHGCLMTVTDIGALDLRAIVKAGLQEMYIEFCIMTEEYSNIRLHAMSVARGRLVARHDVINVSQFGIFQWNKACYAMLTPVFEGNKHYPESVVKITSCGNGRVAILAWRVMRVFVPARTKKKLCVPLSRIPLVWGGAGVGNDFDLAWSEARDGSDAGTGPLSVPRRDKAEVRVGVLGAGAVVVWSYAVMGYNVGVSAWFAQVIDDAPAATYGSGFGGGAGGGGVGEKKKEEADLGPSELVYRQVVPPDMVESTRGIVDGRWTAPSRGVFMLRFDNTHSILRSKTINNLRLQVEAQGAGRHEDEEEDEQEGLSL